ncbi:MAG: cytochrome b N-terminal domain-containing protein, partial [Candidatus Micrarchaeota archaeon]|nr:cytochrome b N-terminal domain-containing protein [Candidatus Micrarchaeota archaeon]
PLGILMRSFHLWAAEAFAFILVLHAFVAFSTSAFRSTRRLVWMLGSLLLFISLIQAEFGFGLRGDFSSQWRSLQGADFWNGAGLGWFVNPLNSPQVLGLHSVIIPFAMIALIFVHFSLVKKLGIAKPYRKDIEFEMVDANHRILFVRGFALVAAIAVLAVLFPSPLEAPVTIQSIAQSNPAAIALTFASEFNHTSGTATYMDNIDPYIFDTRQVFVASPYVQYLKVYPGNNLLAAFNSETQSRQLDNIAQAQLYFAGNGSINLSANPNPLIPLFSSLTVMAQSGLYEASLNNALPGGDQTYALRFLSDTGYLGIKAESLGISLEQYGMIKDERGWLPPNSWWLAPLAVMDNTILAGSQNQDRIGALILGLSMFLFILFPFIPWLNEIPDKLGLYRIFWKVKR